MRQESSSIKSSLLATVVSGNGRPLTERSPIRSCPRVPAGVHTRRPPGTGRRERQAPGGIAEPQVRLETPDGRITAIAYRPSATGPAPLIVRVHPGPTHHSELRLDWEVRYVTSRGFTVVDVDYRGSTGYGRAFRKALDGAWGTADVDDCTAVGPG